MRRNRRRRTNFYNQNIKNKMEQKRFTITITELLNETSDFEVRNEGFSEFELIGILVHVLETRKEKLNFMMNEAGLEKEMD
jgi:hypothetical protein